MFRTVTEAFLKTQKTGLVHCHRYSSSIQRKKYGRVSMICLNIPEKINAINTATLQQLRETIDNFENDSGSNIAVLYGYGGNFSSGLDLKELSESTNERIAEILKEFQEFLLKPAKKPIIAAVNGYAVGQGLDLALWCDARIIEESALIGFLNTRFGIPTCDATIDSLSKMIGTSRAMAMLFQGKCIPAKQALDWGICMRTALSGTAIGEALDFANRTSQHPQERLLADRARILQQSRSPIIIEDRESLLEVSLKKYRCRIDDFLRNEFGRNGSFKTNFKDDELFFLKKN